MIQIFVELSACLSQAIEFTLEVTSLVTNVPSTDPSQLWQMPAYDGYDPIDLADPSVVINPAVTSPVQ